MTSTIEISLYPLNNDYPSSVLAFLEKLRKLEGLEVRTNGMSTIIIGGFDGLWTQLGELVKLQLSSEDSVFVMKVAAGRREYVV